MATGESLPDAGARFRPEGQHELGPSGQVARITANINAIRLLRAIQDEGRPAEPGEQAFLARWSGWGAVPQVFDEANDRFADARAELRSLLTGDEWTAARRTTMNAHYTDAGIVRATWDAVTGLGFNGGTVLEPGCGSGNFIGFAPASARMLGVELDPLTAGIAAALYPDAEIRNESFADSRLPEGGFDLVIGNVPFSSVILTDPRHNEGRHSMHNHFIVKSLALTRPGGLVAVLTSRYTMDAQDSSARREMGEMADLVTAIRLPSGAHRRAAGTEAVTDLVILRRREEGRPPSGTEWRQAFPAEFDGGTAWVNGYFRDHPESVIGDLAVDGGQYSSAELIVRPRGELARVPAELAERLAGAVDGARTARLAMSPREPWRKMADVRAGGGRISLRIPSREASRFEGTISALADGTFTVLRGGDAEPWECPASQQAELRALLRLRDAASALLDGERASAEDTPRITELRTRLNREYDAYARTYGALNRMSWRRTGRTDDAGNETWARQTPAQGGFRQDPYAAIVYALEDYDPETATASKAAIFTQRVISPREPPGSAETPADAIAICMDDSGEIRLDQAARLLGLASLDQAREALGELVYDEPGTGKLVPAAEYLSGKVRDKLTEAEKAAESDSRFRVNVAALRRALPADLRPGDIDARLGASWIPPELVQQGLREILQDPRLTVTKGHGTTWTVEGNQESVLARQVYGTSDKDAVSLAQSLLEQRPIKVSYSMDDLDREDRARLDSLRDSKAMNTFIRSRAAAATVSARGKADELSERFTEWLWADPRRSAELTRLYNAKFNSLVLRSYDGAQPRLPGLASWFRPHPHQFAAVARIVSEPAALLAHEVGAGKTAEMAMGAMELRRLGLVSKPAIIVPNHMLEQFQREFIQLYPQARVLACGAKDLEKGRRHAFIARIATGDWDAVIMSRSVFERIPMSAAEQDRYIKAKLAAYDEWLVKAAAESEDHRMVKRMENQRLSFEERLKRKLSRARDAGISWEQTGIDYLFVDEAHGYKNLDTRSNNSSLDIDGSGRASDLEMKLDYLRRRRGRRVVTFATATPIANSMTEAYVMLKYLRPDLLTAAGIEDFDGWVGSFASTTTDVEVAPEGGLRVKERVASFRNVPELLLMWRVFADVKTAEDLKLPVPALAGGKPEVVTVPASDELRWFMLSLASRAEEVRSGQVDPREDNMLKISTDGRAAALDLRLTGRRAPASGKLDVAADRIASIYHDAKDTIYLDRNGNPEPVTGALQIVFCELGTPTGKSQFGVYQYLREQLAARGMPASQVRFMHEARNDKEKAELFALARAGKISVLIGTTELMGVGTNVQKRAIALHHLDCPWRPADVAQREGRIIRQGNQNTRVQIFRYVTQGSFDAYMWQTVLRKAKFIAQVMRGSVDSRDMEDVGGTDTLSYSEVTALATGDMRILAKAKADADVQRLSRLESSWRRSQRHLKESIGEGERRIPYLREQITRYEAVLAQRTETKGDAFNCRLSGQAFTKRADAAAHLQDTARRLLGQVQQAWMQSREEGTATEETHALGTFGGVPLQATAFTNGFYSGVEFQLAGIAHLPSLLAPDDINADRPPLGLIARLENQLAGLDGLLTDHHEELAHTQAEIERARAALGAPFSKAAELAAARAEADRLTAELGGRRAAPAPEPQAHETPVADAQSARDSKSEEATANPAAEAAAQGRESGEQQPEPSEDGEAVAWSAPAGGAEQATASGNSTAIPPADDDQRTSRPSLTDIARASEGRIQIIPVGFPPAVATGGPGTSPRAGSPGERRVPQAGPEAQATAGAEQAGADPAGSVVEDREDGSHVPDGTQPVAGHREWGGTLRPERLLYPDGTPLTVFGQGDDGEEWRHGTAAGCIAAPGDEDYGPGLLQVVRWDDGSHQIVHPALVCATGIDPYDGLSDRDRARWQAFDRYEAQGLLIAYLPAGLVDPGDTLQVERGPRSRVLDRRGVRSIREVTDGPVPEVEFTIAGQPGTMVYPVSHRVGVYVQAGHPTLNATIGAVTGKDVKLLPGREPEDQRLASSVSADSSEPGEPGRNSEPRTAQESRPPAQDTGGIRIEHDAEGTRVYGTSRDQAGVVKALKDQGFKWSRNQGYWYLNRSWHHSTRNARVGALQATLRRLGVSLGLTQDPRQATAATPEPEPQAEHQAPAAVPDNQMPAGAAGETPAVIRVDHSAAETRVYGVDNADSDVTRALTIQQFRQSADNGYWYLPEQWNHRVRETRVLSLLGQLRALGRTYERVGDSDLIRIEHDADGTRVYGTNNRYSDLTREFRRLDFVWSEDQACWVLPPSWKYETRDNRVHFLRGRLESLGRQYVQSDVAPRAAVAGPDGGHAAASAPNSAGEPTPTAEPSAGTDPLNAEPAAADPGEMPGGTQQGMETPPGTGSEGSPVITSAADSSEYEQQSLFGTPAPRKRQVRGGQPRGTQEPEPQPVSAAAAASPEPATTATGETAAQEAEQHAPGQPAPADSGKGQPDAADAGTQTARAPVPADITAVADSLTGIPVDTRPYNGGRAQAVSGSKIIDNDYRAWEAAHVQAGDARLPDEHPRVRQFTTAWKRVDAKGLDDGPGPAAARYHALAHAAMALAAAIGPAANPGERAALDLIATHARKHSVRLRATDERMFTSTRQAGRYDGGRPQAERGSRMIEQDYRAWIRTGSPLEAARDPQLWQHAHRAEQAWHAVRRHGITDGPAPAATRYRELADAAQALADGFTATLPSSSLPALLVVADHARRHSARLFATARASAGSGSRSAESQQADRELPAVSSARDAIPDHLDAVARRSYASQHPRTPGSAASVIDPAARDADARRWNYAQDRSRD